MNHLAMGHGYYIINGLAAFFQLRRTWLTLSTMMGSRKLPKSGKQTRWEANEASKAFYGYPQAGVSGKSYTAHLLF